MQIRALVKMLVCLLVFGVKHSWADEPPGASDVRKPSTEAELKYWLENMVVHHGFDRAEIVAATGLSLREVDDAIERFQLRKVRRNVPLPATPLILLPYPGGRHPRIGFLDGAIRPQRETKVSVFTPWDPASYVVVDVPEAIWSNLGLTYLAHTHIPTVWTKQGVELEPLEWNRRADGSLDIERKLPNGIAFKTHVVPSSDAVRMKMSLTNGTDQILSDLRVQMCVMLKGARGFNVQTNDNKELHKPYAVCRSGDRWIITAWEPCHRVWGNPPCPCLHSDPKFPDCAPGETKEVRGWLSFYEGDDIRSELERIDATGWRTD